MINMGAEGALGKGSVLWMFFRVRHPLQLPCPGGRSRCFWAGEVQDLHSLSHLPTPPRPGRPYAARPDPAPTYLRMWRRPLPWLPRGPLNAAHTSLGVDIPGQTTQYSRV